MSNSNIVIPKNEKRKIDVGVLDNFLKYSIIHDDNDDKSYVAVAVNTGSEMDPENYQGLAHFLEHMLFLGSKKFPGEKDFEEKVKMNGGMTNAYTSGNTTVYYLSILHEGLEEILEMFAQFFINPLFNEGSVNREVNAVNSEHEKNIQDDLWRIYRFKSILSNPDHPIYNFSTGSLETLQKEDIREKMIQFYRQFYCANNIAISISSNKSIDETKQLIDKYFSVIESKDEMKQKELYLEKVRTTPVLKENTKGKWFQLIPIKDLKVLTYYWIIPSEIINYQSKNWGIISYVMGNNGTNSFIDHLKKKGYLKGFDVDIENYMTFTAFTVSVFCTKNGMENINYVNTMLNKYLQQLKQFTNWDVIANDYQQIAKTKYNFGSKESSMSLVLEFVESMFKYPLNEIYSAPFLVSQLQHQKIPNLLENFLNPNKAVKILLSKNIDESKKLQQEKFYGLKYCEISPLVMDSNLNFNFEFIGKNEFLPDKIVHHDLKQTVPIKLNKSYELWYGSEGRFNEPVGYGLVQLYSATLVNTPKNYLLTNILLKLIDKNLVSKIYLASICGYNYNLSLAMLKNSIIISVTGFNSNYMTFLNYILTLFFEKQTFDDVLIQTEIDEMLIELKNRDKLNPIQYGDYILNKDSFRNSYDNNLLITKLKQIEINDVNEYYQNFLEKYSVLAFFYGNLKKEDLDQFTFFENHQNNGFIMEKEKISKTDLIVNHPNKNEKNNLVKFIYPMGEFNPKMNVLITLFTIIFENEFYDFCRTKNQLGYIVGMTVSRLGQTYILEQTVQSLFPEEKIIQVINQFNGNIVKLFDEMTSDEFIKWKESLTNLYLEKDTDTSSVNARYISEILRRTFLFDRHEILAKLVKQIRKEELISFYQEYIIKNKKRFKLIVKA